MRKEALSYKADHGDEGNTEQENEPVSTADVPGPVDISSEDLSIPKDNENLESVDPSNDSSLELTHADNAMQETSTNHIDEMSGILFVFAESSIHSEFNKANLDMNKKEEDYGYEYFSLSEFWNGSGVLFEGCIQKRSHFQISDCKKRKSQYYIFFIKIIRAHRRKFDSSGTEIEPNFSETKKVSTGYLNSSYKVEARGQTDLLDNRQALETINKPELTKLTEKYGSSDLAAVWLSEDQIRGLEFESGDNVRVKTRGDGPFVFSIAKIDCESSTVSNYAGGESVGASWTDKIMDMKSDVPTTKENEGVDEDEWDD